MLTEVESRPSTFAKENMSERKPLQIPSIPSKKEESQSDKSAFDVPPSNIINEKKSEILMKAIRKMEKTTFPEKEVNPKSDTNESTETNSKFPKYFSNAFETEARKDIKKKEETDNVENVTNLIREKLRSMKPLN